MRFLGFFFGGEGLGLRLCSARRQALDSRSHVFLFRSEGSKDAC